MTKTEIAKLVQIERHRNFARFRARELAAVDAVNTGIHVKLITPWEKPTDEKLFEAFTGGESANYWGPFFSKRLTLDESAGLLMALDTSQVEFAAHVVGGNIPAKNRSRFGIAEDLVNAFKDMRGHVEVALQKKDLFADRDKCIESFDLITWAKEKGCVADEVLTAWDGFNSEAVEPKPQKAPATPDAVEARQVTAPATSPTPVMEDSASEAPAWTVSKPQRFHGYSMPLYRLLAAAYREGKPRSTARDVVEAWRINKPAEVAKVLPDGFDYYDAQGNTKHADLEAIRKAIGRMISAR